MAISYNFSTDSWGSLASAVKGFKFALIGRNLFTISNYSGYDPEVAWHENQFDATINGLDGYGYPNFRTITGALEIKF